MIFLLLLFLPTQLGLHFWPQWALVNGIRVDYLSPTIYLTDLIILGLWLKSKTSPLLFPSPKLRRWVRGEVNKLLLIILIVLNIFFSLSPLTSIFKWLRILEYYWLYKYLRTQDAGRRMQGLNLAILWTSLLAWMQFIRQSSIGGLWYFMGERNFNIFTPNIAKVFWEGLILRPYATFPHPNVLGGWLVVAGLMTGGWPMAIAFTALIFTFSRTAIFAAIAAVLIYKRKFFLLPLILVPFMIPGSPDSYSGRVDLVKTSVNIIRGYPLFGTGLGNFVRLSPQPVHNVFLLAIAELGFPFFVYLIILSFNHLLKIKNYKLKIVVAVLVITATMDHYWWTIPQMQLMFTFLLAFAVKYSHDQSHDFYRRWLTR